jgi:hypothetical protein
MARLVSSAIDGFARAVAVLYAGLGALAVVLGLGLFAGIWTLQQIGGGAIEKAVDPGFFLRLVLPFLLATRIVRESSALFLVVIGGCHLAGGYAFIQRWAFGRYLLIALSGFYVVLQLLLVGRALLIDVRSAAPPLAFLGLHLACFWTFAGRAPRR